MPLQLVEQPDLALRPRPVERPPELLDLHPHLDPVAEPRGPGSGASGATAAKPADGHAVTDQAIVADHRGGMDHDAVLMGDPETAADMGAVGELDAVDVARDQAEETVEVPRRHPQGRSIPPSR